MGNIIDFPNYRVTHLGEVLNLVEGHSLMKALTKGGYHRVWLSNDLGRKMFLVHRLVMAAFVGPSSMQINHINGIKTNNRLANLEYVTPQENIRHGMCNLNQQEIDSIRVERAAGSTLAVIAKRYNVCWSTVSEIICNRKLH